jgi:predicted nucleic acid-binding protein
MEASIKLFSLHAGEIQALNIVQEYQADLLLTDDTAARLAARSMQISVHGTLGILLRSIQKSNRLQKKY